MKLDLTNWFVFLLAAVFCVVYLIVSRQTARRLCAESRRSMVALVADLLTAGIFLSWVLLGFPLPTFYLLLYITRGLRFRGVTKRHMRLLFWNLPFLRFICLQMLLIGVFSLIAHIGMKGLLDHFFYRAFLLTAALAANILMDFFLLRLPDVAKILSMAEGSEEIKPFLTFLWASLGYSLLDSVLCFADPEPFFSPLFLIGSNLLLQFFLFQFVRHAGILLKNHWMEARYAQLREEEQRQKQRNSELRSLIDTDTLTGVYSRRYALERMQALMDEGLAFSLVFLDLDRLKLINDREGHNAGDQYLIRFAALFGSLLRKGDIFARFGGDEFLVLMPGCKADVAKNRINAIRSKLESCEGWTHPYSFSFGVSYLAAGTKKEAESLLHDADREMYKDKDRLK